MTQKSTKDGLGRRTLLKAGLTLGAAQFVSP
jgi:hypothetical protein